MNNSTITKKQAIATLIKDGILIGSLFALGAALTATDPNLGAGFCLGLAGIPFGWRWASNIITATSLKGIGLKLAIAICLGFVAIFVVTIRDAIRCITAPSV